MTKIQHTLGQIPDDQAFYLLLLFIRFELFYGLKSSGIVILNN